MSRNELGWAIHDMLKGQGIETPFKAGDLDPNSKHVISKYVAGIMNTLGLDHSDDSLRDTPGRVAKMYCDEVFYGLDYEKFPDCTSIENKMGYDEIVIQKCTVMSMCEHHFVPFQGVAYVGYIPGTKVIGLSKMNRVVDFFSRRPQVQERLTAQIHATLAMVLETVDVAVVIQAEHLCVKLRGIRDAQSKTTTSKLSGRFMEKPPLREEFLMLSLRSGTQGHL